MTHSLPVQRRQHCRHIASLRTSLSDLLVQVMPPLEVEMGRKKEAACIQAKEAHVPSLGLGLTHNTWDYFFSGKFPTSFFFLFSTLLSEVLGSGPMETFTKGLRLLFSISCCVLSLSFGIGSDHNTAKYYWASWVAGPFSLVWLFFQKTFNTPFFSLS